MCTQAKFSEATELCDRSIAIRQEELGPDHPDVAKSLNALAKVLIDQVNLIPRNFINCSFLPLGDGG